MSLFLLWKTSHNSFIEIGLACRLISVYNFDVFWSVESGECNAVKCVRGSLVYIYIYFNIDKSSLHWERHVSDVTAKTDGGK